MNTVNKILNYQRRFIVDTLLNNLLNSFSAYCWKTRLPPANTLLNTQPELSKYSAKNRWKQTLTNCKSSRQQLVNKPAWQASRHTTAQFAKQPAKKYVKEPSELTTKKFYVLNNQQATCWATCYTPCLTSLTCIKIDLKLKTRCWN
jgi:hypothetical protein